MCVCVFMNKNVDVVAHVDLNIDMGIYGVVLLLNFATFLYFCVFLPKAKEDPTPT